MANPQFIVLVSRYISSTQPAKGSGYVDVLRIETLDTHAGAATTTFDELKKRFPASEGFRLTLHRHDEAITQVATHP